MPIASAAAFADTRTYYTSHTAELPVPVRWVHAVNATVAGAHGTTVRRLPAGAAAAGWVAGAVGSQALAERPGAFQGALSWQVPPGWHRHFFLGLVAADANAADPGYASHTLGLYLNVDAASGDSLSFDAYQAGTPRYAGRQASPPVYWRAGAWVEVQVWRTGGGFEGRFLLDDQLIYTLPLPAGLAFPLSPHLSFHGPEEATVGGFVLRGPRLVPGRYAQLPDNPRGWWRADAGVQLDAGGTLQAWADQSGYGHDLTPAPGLAAPAPVAWGSSQALAFDGGQGLAPVSLGLATPPAVLTTVLVLQARPGLGEGLALGLGADLAHAASLRLFAGMLGLSPGTDGLFGTHHGHDLLAAGPVVLAAEWHSNNPAAFRLFLNGQPLPLGARYQQLLPRPLDDVLTLGGPAPGLAAGRWQGWLAECLVYDRALGEATHAELADALGQRYALALDAGREMLANSTFAGNLPGWVANWAAQTNWTIGGGAATVQNGQGVNGADYIYQDLSLEPGVTYEVEFRVSAYTSGTLGVVPYPGEGGLPAAAYGVGVHRYRFVARSLYQRWHLAGSDNAHFTLASFSVRRAAPDAYHPAAGLPAAGLRLHLRPDHGLTLTADGRFDQWADQSPYALTVRSEGSPEPALQPLAGGQALHFNGAQALPVELAGPTPTVLTAVLVLQAERDSIMPLHFGAGSHQDLWLYGDNFGLNTFNSDIRGIGNAAALLGQPVVVAAEVHHNDPGAFRLWLNGVAQVVTQRQSSPGYRSLDNLLRLGGPPSYSWRGYLGEMAFYDRPLTDDEHYQVYAALRGRYPELPAYAPPPPPAPYLTAPDPQPPTAAEVPAGPRGWWRAANGLTTQSDRLVEWADLSGQGLTLRPYAGYDVPDVVSWAGGRALYFRDDKRLAPLELAGPAPAVLTAALVLQADGDSTMPLHFGAGPNQDLWLQGDYFGLNTYGGDIFGIDNASARLRRPVVVLAEVHGNDPTAFRLWLNGVAQPLAQRLGGPSARPLDTTVFLGGYASWPWRGWLAECLLYDRVLAEAEQQRLVAYLSSRYAV